MKTPIHPAFCKSVILRVEEMSLIRTAVMAEIHRLELEIQAAYPDGPFDCAESARLDLDGLKEKMARRSVLEHSLKVLS